MNARIRARAQQLAAKKKEKDDQKRSQKAEKRPPKPLSSSDEPPRQAPIDTTVYFEPRGATFWHMNGLGEWQEAKKGSLELLLRANWFSQYEKLTNSLSILEAKVLDIIQNHSVKYAGPLAGWEPGLREICGHRVLVTKGPKIPVPRPGKFTTLHRFLVELLGDQRSLFNGWLKSAYKSLREGAPFAPGQLLTIAGEPGCGKSLLQKLITEMLGGRMAKPYRYLSGKTDFNGDLLKAEHLMLEDEEGKTDHRSRRLFGAALKTFVVNQQQSAHPKGGEAFTSEPFWRVTFSLNDEPESLLVLPPLQGDIADKIILLRASKATFPYPSKEFPTMQDFWNGLVSEIPAYLHRLSRWEIPSELRDHRYGVKAYHNPELLHKLASLSAEAKLWAIILESGILDSAYGVWSGSSVDLERELKTGNNAAQVQDLLYYPTACGVYLSRLSKSMPKNVEREDAKGNKVVWHLCKDTK